MKSKLGLFLLLALLFSTLVHSPSLLAVKYVPLDIVEGQWELKINIANLMSNEQRSQIKKAMEKLEELKKTNPAMAAQMSKVTQGLGINNNTIVKKNCLRNIDMQNGMDKVLTQESASGKECKGHIIKSTSTYLEGDSKCGDKTHHYIITVQDKKHMKTVVTSGDVKKMEIEFSWLSAKCKE